MSNKNCKSGNSPADLRFEWALEYMRALREKRPDISIEILDRVCDDLVDALASRSDLGQTPAAVRGLGRRILGWRIADALKRDRNPDGTYRHGPGAACSLDAEVLNINGEGGSQYELVSDPHAVDPEQILVYREEMSEIIDCARERGDETLEVVLETMRGMSATEIAESQGVSVDVVYQRKSRFIRFYGS